MTGLRLRGKRILVTAGPTWVGVDPVRVLSNISTGEMGVAIAREAARRGAAVDLCLGPVGIEAPVRARLFRFTYFSELQQLLDERLRTTRYDAIVHAAAVSDYLVNGASGKIASDKAVLTLRLTPAPKLIDRIRRAAPRAVLVMFKLEAGVSDAVLLRRALFGMRRSGADLVVANRFEGPAYRGFVLGEGRPVLCRSRREAARRLMTVIAERIAS